MMSNIDNVENYKLLDKITNLEKKLDLVLEQFDLVLKTNARLRADLQPIIKEAISAALNKRAISGYSKIAGG